MLLSNVQIEQILDIIRQRHNLLVIKTIGQELLSEEDLEELKNKYGEDAIQQIADFVKDGYYVGYLRSKDLGSVTDVNHKEFTEEQKPSLNEFQNYSIEHSKEVIDSYLQKLSQQVRTGFETLIHEYNKRYKDYLMTNVGVPLAILADQEGKSVGDLIIAMRDLTGDYARDWERVARTETTNVINTGMVDRIVDMNPDTRPEDIYVFKRVVNDRRLCPYCKRLHLMEDGVTPRIYRLSEVMANGSNVGRKSGDWKMVIGAVHPFCRCQLVQIPPGYFFNKEGKLEFIGLEQSKKKIEDLLSS